MTDASSWQDSDGHAPARASWDEAGVEPEQRTAPRFTLLIRTAKLVGASGEYLCIVRDVSPQGLKVRTFYPLPRDEEFAIELASGERHPVGKVWEEGELTGFRFAVPVALERLLAEAPEGMRKRSVRLRLAMPATLVAGGRPANATFVDISQHGACVECEQYLAKDERVRIDCDWLPELTARVRWRKRPLYGLIFEQTFRFDELAKLTAPLQARTLAARAPQRRAVG